MFRTSLIDFESTQSPKVFQTSFIDFESTSSFLKCFTRFLMKFHQEVENVSQLTSWSITFSHVPQVFHKILKWYVPQDPQVTTNLWAIPDPEDYPLKGSSRYCPVSRRWCSFRLFGQVLVLSRHCLYKAFELDPLNRAGANGRPPPSSAGQILATSSGGPITHKRCSWSVCRPVCCD